MTKLQAGKPVVRETRLVEGDKPVIVELHPKELKIRVKGRHEVFSVTYDLILDLARKLRLAPRG